MKKTIVYLLLALLLAAGAWHWLIARNGQEYLQRILDADRRAAGDAVDYRITRYEGGWSGAEAEVEMLLEKLTDRFPRLRGVLREPLLLHPRLSFGPFFASPSPGFGLVTVRMERKLSTLLEPEARKRWSEYLKEDPRLSYVGRLGFSGRMKEKATLSALHYLDRSKGVSLDLAPVRIRQAYLLEELTGDGEITTARMRLDANESGEHLSLLGPKVRARVDERLPAGLTFGAYGLVLPEISYRKERSPVAKGLKLSAEMAAGLHREDQRRAALELSVRTQALDDATAAAARGVRSSATQIRIEHLGVEGLRELATLEDRQRRLQEKLARATQAGDDVAIQKAILALNALNDDLIPIINHLLIPGTTRLRVDQTLSTDRRSVLHLDLTYTGTGSPLTGGFIGAMITLGAHADRLFKGKLELKLQKEIVQKLYPNAVFVLDSMVQKNMAKLEKGFYLLKARLEDGKIVINGTRYAPQELMLMILI